MSRMREHSLSTVEKLFLWLGPLAVIGFSLAAILAGRIRNFEIFSYGCLDFWSGVNPYTQWSHTSINGGRELDVYLYGPLFSFLFYPLTLFPKWLGALLWALLNYFILVWGILKTKLWERKELLVIFFFNVLVIVNNGKAFQYNNAVTGFFLLMLYFLEEQKPWAALVVLVLGSLTKVYLAFGAVLFLFYPDFWKNVLRGVGLLLVGIFLPAVAVGLEGLLDQYQGWVEVVSMRGNPFRFLGLPGMLEQWGWSNVYQYTLLMLVLGLGLPALFVWLGSVKSGNNSYELRAMLLGSTMLGLMVWGNSTEAVTWVIGLVGFFLWFYGQGRPFKWWDYFWLVSLGFFFVVCPMDFLFPVSWRLTVLWNLRLGTIFATLLWGWMVGTTLVRSWRPSSQMI